MIVFQRLNASLKQIARVKRMPLMRVFRIFDVHRRDLPDPWHDKIIATPVNHDVRKLKFKGFTVYP